jgi:hypothetical protein
MLMARFQSEGSHLGRITQGCVVEKNACVRGSRMRRGYLTRKQVQRYSEICSSDPNNDNSFLQFSKTNVVGGGTSG